MIGDWLFASSAFPSDFEKHKQYAQYLRNKKLSIYSIPIQMESLIKIKESIPHFIETVIKQIIVKQPKIVGFSCGINRTFACIAFTNALKKINPNIITVLGGQKFPESMGEKLLQIAPSIDYIFSGEADFEFLDFCSNVLHHNNLPNNHFIDCPPIADVNTLPYPDHSDFLEQFEIYGKTNLKGTGRVLTLTFESSRGCWWGTASHCCFCGLYDPSIQFRPKTPDRIREEIFYLFDKYKISNFYATDNILGRDFPNAVFKGFRKPIGLRNIFYEVRPTLKFEELEIMKKVGLNHIQPGLENLNNHLLTLLNKRTTALNNIRFLRDCQTLDMDVKWNFLYGIPGETQEDYREIIKIIPILAHIQPPVNFSAIRIMRHSPLFEESKKYNITNLRPLEGYRYLLPNTSNLEDLAWIFTGNFPTAFEENPRLKEQFSSAIQTWQQSWGKRGVKKPTLSLVKGVDNSYSINDTRFISKKESRTLETGHFHILTLLKTPRDESTIKSHLKSEESMHQFDELLEWNYILNLNNNFLTLPTRGKKTKVLDKSLDAMVKIRDKIF